MHDFTLISKRCDPKNQQQMSKSLRKTLEKDFTYVSISHKEDRLVGIGSPLPCGIDIEKQAQKHPAFKDFVVSSAEAKIVNDPVLAWSIKESCFKVFNDGYEIADFTILSKQNDIFQVCSSSHNYWVSLLTDDSFFIAIAFVSSSNNEYSNL